MDIPDPRVDEFLEHSGVKGMKWGVRRSGGYDKLGRQVRGGTKNKPDLAKVSNKDLDARIKRLEQEKKYTQLTAKPSSQLAALGKAQANKFIVQQGFKLAVAAAPMALGALGKAYMSRKTSSLGKFNVSDYSI